MPSYNAPILRQLLETQQFAIPITAPDLTSMDVDKLINVYDLIYPELERLLWHSSASLYKWLGTYQGLFREQQVLIKQFGTRSQYHFILSIPVADRPAHLHTCLESIYQLCELYTYGGKNSDGSYAKVTVIVAEDSYSQQHMQQHQELVAAYVRKGLQVIYFSQTEQYQLLQAIPEQQRQHLGQILTTQAATQFYHKGQAANRNLSYLKMRQLTRDKTSTLYYFVDSDQAFLINPCFSSGEHRKQHIAALNYFYYIDRIFQTNNIAMLTGKLVGDPPVSPTVMAENFLTDVDAFLQQMAQYRPEDICQFHSHDAQYLEGAAYHDMAKLFGFKQEIQPVKYRCPLSFKHNNAACLDRFVERLQAFFFGEHLTRATCFRYSGTFIEISPARTIYPGNYIVNFAGLKYIIPFGHLRLRMSGPTAGRLVQAEIGNQFASVNLPMLHQRTHKAHDNFRPGVKQETEQGLKRLAITDIANEFERQFFGDVMLFTVIECLKKQDLAHLANRELLTESVNKVTAELLDIYQAKHVALIQRVAALKFWLETTQHWWYGTAAMEKILQFLNTTDLNFQDNAPAWQLLQSASHCNMRKQQIIDALMNYHNERTMWDQLFT